MRLRSRRETWPVAGVFRIARGAVTAVEVVVVEVEEDGVVGRGEGCPESRYHEGAEGCLEQIDGLRAHAEAGLDRVELQDLLPAGAARNALDCALWDLEAKRRDVPAWRIAGLGGVQELVTAYTISLDRPETMGERAAGAADRPLLKIKLGGEGGALADVARVAAVHAAAPSARLIVDANEAWNLEQLREIAPRLADLGVELIEQPLPASADVALEGFASPVPLAADESCRDRGSLDAVRGRYHFVNIKLDKTGGLTEALALAEAAAAADLRLMVGCMLGTSLAMAPAALIGQRCELVDLDGPLLLAEDRVPCIRYDGGVMLPAPRELWG
ncbi:MAG TPA: N-acetyl-D-Glu racemase DgcA [Thermoanaerobaculia bacterium]|nr:N-acetyl-D-Glu racemase DgcA [Thermoanaerobaculia bacterium]